MKIIQNFSTRKKEKTFKIVDLLIWKVSLIQYKKLGYSIKLYCEEKDIPFLKTWQLYDYYDEIDTTFLKDNQNIKNIDALNFWSYRKLEIINFEFQINKEPFLYSDTDVVMFREIPIEDIDLVVWSDENEGKIYLNWDYLSTPLLYKMPDFIKNTEYAFNSGILYFKNYQIFDFYRNHYLNFVKNNPCVLFDVECEERTMHNIWACNAEQRILKAVSNHLKLRILKVMSNQGEGLSSVGNHYYFLRAFWSIMYRNDLLNIEQINYLREKLNQEINNLYNLLDDKSKELFLKIDWIKNLVKENIKICWYK